MSESKTLGEKLIEKIVEFCTTSGLKLLGAVLIIFIGFKVVKFLTGVVTRSKFYGKLEPTARSFCKSAVTISLKIIILVTAAAMLGVPMTSIIAVIGSAGLAIGLALQGGLSNIAGGFVILVFKPFMVGDYIEVGEFSGIVHSISVFYTKIYTLDNKKIMIPNSMMSSQSVVDFSALPTRRVDIKFSVAYDSDIDEVKNILIGVAEKEELVLSSPTPPFARLKEHGDSALIFELRAWCNTEDYWTVFFDLTENVKKAFDENGIQIPFPQMDVHFDKDGKV
ncbi:MAG: mechanosensitive ion channel [Clostridiales bacterium]|nr:mechanosensitive ion channel [Clostridiales bacterium]